MGLTATPAFSRVGVRVGVRVRVRARVKVRVGVRARVKVRVGVRVRVRVDCDARLLEPELGGARLSPDGEQHLRRREAQGYRLQA